MQTSFVAEIHLEKLLHLHLMLVFLAGHAIEDTFVAKVHSEKLLAKYGSEDKELMLFEGDHNSIRPRAFYAKVLLFFHNCLQCQDVLIPDEQNPGQFELAMEDAAR